MHYIVTWEIDIEADTPREVAEEAQKIMQDLESTATYFTVSTPTETIDLAL